MVLKYLPLSMFPISLRYRPCDIPYTPFSAGGISSGEYFRLLAAYYRGDDWAVNNLGNHLPEFWQV